MMKNIPMISCSFLNATSLYSAYMPFVKNGGLFIRTNQSYPLGARVDLIVSLLDEQEPYFVEGKVVWITPVSAQTNKPAGVGIQLPSAHAINHTIEIALKGNSSVVTDTI